MSEEQAPYGVSYIASAPEELKVGDRVEIVGGEPRFIGETGVIVQKESIGIAFVRFNEGCLLNYEKFRIDQLRKIPDTTSFEDSDNPMDRQVGGNHYDMPIQPVEFIERNGLGFCVGNCIKYLCRYKKKNGKEDLLKAKHYIDLLIQLEYPE